MHPYATVEAAQAVAQRLTSRKVPAPAVQQPGKRARPVPRPAPLPPASQQVCAAQLPGVEGLLPGVPATISEPVPTNARPEAAQHSPATEAIPDSAGSVLRTGGEAQTMSDPAAAAPSGDIDGKRSLQMIGEAMAVSDARPEASGPSEPSSAVDAAAGLCTLPVTPVLAVLEPAACEKDAAALSGAAPALLPGSVARTAYVTSDTLLRPAADVDGDADSSGIRPMLEPSQATNQQCGGHVAAALPETLALGKRAAKRQRRMQREAEMAAAAAAATGRHPPTALDTFLSQAVGFLPGKRRKA